LERYYLLVQPAQVVFLPILVAVSIIYYCFFHLIFYVVNV
jgi:hypothetical protein